MDIRDYVMMLVDGREYRIAFVRADGEFDVVDRFMAVDDAGANAYAETYYSNRLSPSNDEWFVLDRDGRNINGGEQS
jgi:hypothetical protein